MSAPEEKTSEAGDGRLAPGLLVTPTVRLTQPLREGGMGAVWLADHTSLKTQVVVKFMLGELGSSESARLRFSREAAAAAKVKSPHVVQMHDHGLTDGGLPFIVMEYLEGHDLGKELQQKGPIPPARAVTIISQVAKALAKVHAAGLLHRDIKPDNIFLVASDDDEVFVKLLDFGIAKSHADGVETTTMDGQTKTGQVVGTPFYMSPEQVTAQKTIDTRSDLWALGVVAFEALTGQRPFDGPSFGALAVKIATGDPPKITAIDPSLPPALDGWFARALAREPSKRFDTAKEMVEAFRAAFDGVVSLPPGHSMSDSGPRGTTTRVSGTNETSGPVSIDHAQRGSDRPSFVLASTLAKSEHGLEVDGARRSQGDDEKKGTPKSGVRAAAVVIALVGVVAIKLLDREAPQPTPPDTKKPVASVTKAPAAKPSSHAHAHPPPSATASTSASSEASEASEGADAGALATASASASKPVAPPTTTTTARPTGKSAPSSKPEPRPSAAPSGTIDVW